MGNVTVAEIGKWILAIGGMIGALSAITAFIIKMYGKTVGKSIENSIKPLKEDIDSLKSDMKNELEKSRNEFNKAVHELDKGECRNFLVRFLGDIERGTDIDAVEIERAYEIMDHYSKSLNENGYLHARWDEVMQGRSKAATLKKYAKK